MSKRTIYAERIGDGKFIQVDNKKPGFTCPEYPALEEEIRLVQAMLPMQQSGAGVKPPEPASIFDCPSYRSLLQKLIRLKIKLWKLQLQTLRGKGSNYTPGTMPSDLKALIDVYDKILGYLPRGVAKIGKDYTIKK